MQRSEENQVLATLSADAFWSVNKTIGKSFGVENAVLLSELVYKYKYWKERGSLDNLGGFFYTSNDLRQALNISERAAKRLTKAIQKTGLVKVKKRGQPAKNYWYIQFSRLVDILSQAETAPTGQAETGLASERETVPAITKKTNQENNTSDGGKMLMLPQSKPVRSGSVKPNGKAIDFTSIEPVLEVLRKTEKHPEKAISKNTMRMIENALDEYGEQFVCDAVAGRMIQAQKQGKPLYLPSFFDPDSAEWRADCAKIGESQRNAAEGKKTAIESNSAALTESDYEHIYGLMGQAQ